MKHRRIFVALFLLATMGLGCSASTKDAETARREKIQSEIFKDVDEELASVQADAEAIKADYKALQEQVFHRMAADDQTVSQGVALEIIISNHNMISINDVYMSKNDAYNFLQNKLPEHCHPAPKLTMKGNVDYESASWLLEHIYGLGCSEVILK